MEDGVDTNSKLAKEVEVLRKKVAELEAAIERGPDVDLHEWEQVKAALEASEEKFRSVIQSSPMGVHMYRLDAGDRLVFVGANPSADALLGVDNSQFVGKTIEEAFPPLAETEIPDRYRAAAADGTPWHTSQVNYEDEQIAGAFEVYAFQTSRGRMAVMFLDITDRLRAEEALRESEQRHRALFESMAQGVVYQNADGKIIAANHAAERILGIDLDQMIGRTSMDPRWRAIHEDGHAFPGEQHPAMIALRTGKTVNAVMGVFNPRDNEVRWIDIYAVPRVRQGETDPYGVFTTFTDITERKRAREIHAQLEQQLRQAQKMEAVGQLAGGIAHDFNNLLTTIAGYSELVWEDVKSNEQLRNDINEIRKATERAAALTQQLLAFSRKQIISPRVFDLNARIIDANRMLGRLIGENIELNLAMSDGPCYIEADPSQIDQILINLAVNARDAMPDGGNLTISTESAMLDADYCRTVPDIDPGEYVLIHISDTGYGMSQRTLKRIFEPFFTTKDYGKGTGLGLSTVYGIVKQNRGTIKVDSRPGAGTTISIFIPHADLENHTASPAGNYAELTGKETVLLVEDEDAVRALTEKILSSRGYRVLVADTPDDAIQICQDLQENIDLLLTDVVMPQINGRQLYNKLRTIRPGLRVLYMSGYTADVIAKHGVLENDTLFLAKPFTVETLAAKVRETLVREE
jgi:PAS domain S-box-containing protein